MKSVVCTLSPTLVYHAKRWRHTKFLRISESYKILYSRLFAIEKLRNQLIYFSCFCPNTTFTYSYLLLDNDLAKKIIKKSLIFNISLAFIAPPYYSKDNLIKHFFFSTKVYFFFWSESAGRKNFIVGKTFLLGWVSWLMLFFTDDGGENPPLNYISQLCMH